MRKSEKVYNSMRSYAICPPPNAATKETDSKETHQDDSSQDDGITDQKLADMSDQSNNSLQAAQLAAATAQLSSTARGVQVQVLSSQAQTSTNGASVPSAAATSALLTTGSGQEVSATLASQLGAFRLPPDQQKQLLLAHLQQLKSTPLPASILLQPAAVQSGAQLQGLTVVTTTPPTTTTTAKGSGQFVSQFPTEASVLSQSSSAIATQPSMMALQQPLSTAYYDPTQQLQPGMTHVALPHVGDQPHITHSTRAHPQTIQWLLENYETAEGVSLPRSTLYNHYLRHCAANKIDAVNAASFGKLIRSVFIGLKTRRLGTRGNSKYHYYGIRIKPDSPLNTFPPEDSPVVAMRQSSQSSQRDYPHSDVIEGVDGSSQPDPTPQQQHQQYLGDSRPELPSFPEIEWGGASIPASITAEDLNDFTALYREHCEAILDVVVNLQFQMVESLWHHFWIDSKLEIQQSGDEDMEQLSQDKLMLLMTCDPMVEYLSACDHLLYQCIVDFLIPEVLSPIPGTLTQAIRNFAKSLESWLTNTIQGYPQNLVKTKISSVVAFSQTLRRYTSLNHLAQAARAVLQNPTQISQMLADLNRVDFGNVQEQASWVCECDESLVARLEHDFKTTLQQQNTLEQWAAWLEGVVHTVLEPYEGGGHDFTKAARQFLLKWSFYSSMVIRDLTLRSAASFGSFHLIRLLYDEYMFYLIEHKVAKATGRTPIAVMSEFSGHSRTVFNTHDSLSGSETQEDEEPQAKRKKLSH